jgi:hypothetical protein
MIDQATKGGRRDSRRLGIATSNEYIALRIEDCGSSQSLVFALFPYEDRVAAHIQNRAKTIKKHLHPYEKRTTISGA